MTSVVQSEQSAPLASSSTCDMSHDIELSVMTPLSPIPCEDGGIDDVGPPVCGERDLSSSAASSELSARCENVTAMELRTDIVEEPSIWVLLALDISN